MTPLIVAFAPGTSGRFISTICHLMITNNTSDIIKWNNDNSAHDYPLYKAFYENVPEVILKYQQFINTSFVYRYIKLNPYDVMPSHAYPDFDLIKNKVPDVKIIIIRFTANDTDEIINNLIIKNKPITPPTVPEYISRNPKFQLGAVTIPDDYKNITQDILYSDIYKPYKDSFVALEQIKNFLNIEVTPNVLESYRLYTQGRERLLRENNITNS